MSRRGIRNSKSCLVGAAFGIEGNLAGKGDLRTQIEKVLGNLAATLVAAGLLRADMMRSDSPL